MVREKREHLAEYSAAVSRLADSGCSCSECTMRGKPCAQEIAVKEQKGKRRIRKHIQMYVVLSRTQLSCVYLCRNARLCVYVYVSVCVCAPVQV